MVITCKGCLLLISLSVSQCCSNSLCYGVIRMAHLIWIQWGEGGGEGMLFIHCAACCSLIRGRKEQAPSPGCCYQESMSSRHTTPKTLKDPQIALSFFLSPLFCLFLLSIIVFCLCASIQSSSSVINSVASAWGESKITLHMMASSTAIVHLASRLFLLMGIRRESAPFSICVFFSFYSSLLFPFLPFFFSFFDMPFVVT